MCFSSLAAGYGSPLHGSGPSWRLASPVFSLHYSGELGRGEIHARRLLMQTTSTLWARLLLGGIVMALSMPFLCSRGNPWPGLPVQAMTTPWCHTAPLGCASWVLMEAIGVEGGVGCLVCLGDEAWCGVITHKYRGLFVAFLIALRPVPHVVSRRRR